MLHVAALRRALLAAALLPLVGIPLAPPQDPPTAPWPRGGGYVGAARCAGCHESEAELIAAGHHAAVVASDVTMGCETCHGPGALHAHDRDPARITHPQKLAPHTQAELCGRCHRPEADGHGGGGLAGFLKAGLGCTECHFVHDPILDPIAAGVRYRSRQATLESAEPVEAERCAACHPEQRTSLAARGHGRLAADPTGCTTCHGHGSRHVLADGIARLISRPDRAVDGVATCVGCHDAVDPEHAHWAGGGAPFVTDGLSCFVCHSVHGGAAAPPAAPPAATPDTNARCVDCHAPAFVDHVGPDTVHAPLVRPGAPLDAGCGACHAGAAEHARAGGAADLVESLRAAPRELVERTCLACHGDDAALHGLGRGAHARNDVSCTACHAPSAPAGEVRADAERGCATCHATVAARFRLPNRHPVDDRGRMGCSDCHDPHTARTKLRDLELREERCVSCHRQYRGPFVFAHQASRLDGCIACHEPHGSSNLRMLHTATTQQGCIACHGDFPAFHDQTPGAVFTNCLNCHTEVHGSNHSRFLFR